MYKCSYAELGSTVLLVRHLTQLTMHIHSVQPNRHSINYKPACYRSLRAMEWPDLTVSPTLCMYITVSTTSLLLLYTDCQYSDNLTTWLLDTTKDIIIMTGPAKTGHICVANSTCGYK